MGGEDIYSSQTLKRIMTMSDKFEDDKPSMLVRRNDEGLCEQTGTDAQFNAALEQLSGVIGIDDVLFCRGLLKQYLWLFLDNDGKFDSEQFGFVIPRRIRDREHVKSVAKQPCLVCGRRPADAHHLRFAQSPALGRKVSDEFTVPLCRGHHREVHRSRDEVGWWQQVGIDPTISARALWLKTHPCREFPQNVSG
jgi:hypothetical protein